MALLRTKEIRSMRSDDLKLKFKELSDELMHERGVAAMGGAPASPGRLRALRTNIARIHTIMREIELAEAKKAVKKQKEKAEPKPKEKKESKPKKKEKQTAKNQEEKK